MKTIGDARIGYIELWGEVPHAYHDWVDRKRLKDTLSAYDFTLSLHAPFTDLNPATPFEPVKGAVARTLKEFVKFAGELGAVRVTFHPGSVHNGALVSRSVEDAVMLFRHLVKESSGTTTINIENQVGVRSHYHHPVGGNVESIGTLLSNVEGLSYTLDTGHAHVTGEKPMTYFERFRKDVTELHLSDNGGSSDDHLAPGHGTAELQELLHKVKETDILVCLEVNPFKYSPDQVLHAVDRLRGIP